MFRTKEELKEQGFYKGEETNDLWMKNKQNTDLLEEIVIFKYTKKGESQIFITPNQLDSMNSLIRLLISIGQGYYPCNRKTKQELYEYLSFQQMELKDAKLYT